MVVVGASVGGSVTSEPIKKAILQMTITIVHKHTHLPMTNSSLELIQLVLQSPFNTTLIRLSVS